MSSYDWPVLKRVAFYELYGPESNRKIRFLPFFSVTLACSGSGKLFEPRDCMTRFPNGDCRRALKEVHELKEYHGNSNMFMCERNWDGKNIELHKFDCDWTVE
jgi:hypothetical protein